MLNNNRFRKTRCVDENSKAIKAIESESQSLENEHLECVYASSVNLSPII